MQKIDLLRISATFMQILSIPPVLFYENTDFDSVGIS